MMKKLLLITLGFGIAATVSAQNLSKIDYLNLKPNSSWKNVPKPIKNVTSSKTSVLNLTVVPLGSAFNLLTAIVNETNSLSANPELNTVSFIHRNNPAATGSGGSGNYRYDLSTDGGTTFSINQGPTNPLNTPVGRYPQNVVYNPAGNTVANNGFLAYYGSTLGGLAGGFGTNVTGARKLDGSTNTEVTTLNGNRGGLATSLVEGKRGEFWTVDIGVQDKKLYVYKGVFNNASNGIDWVVNKSFDEDFLPTILSAAGDTNAKIAINTIGFDPTGQFGWVGATADTASAFGGYRLFFYKTSDFGATWSAPTVLQLSQFPLIQDSLVSSADTAGFAFDGDIAVDVLGNPHFAAVIGSGTGYSVQNKRYTIFDITYNSILGNFESIFLDTVSTLRGDITSDYSQDNRVQISRSADGSKIFFGWSDTQFANQPGPFDNLFPDLKVVGLNVNTRLTTPVIEVTAGSDIDGQVFFATFAPIALNVTGGYKVPMVIATTPGPVGTEATNFSYVDGIEVLDTEYNQALKSAVYGGFIGLANNVNNNLFSVSNNYPNPFSGSTEVKVSLNKPSAVSLKVVNTLGQVISEKTTNLSAATHTLTIDATELSTGVYFYTVSAGGFQVTNKMIVR